MVMAAKYEVDATDLCGEFAVVGCAHVRESDDKIAALFVSEKVLKSVGAVYKVLVFSHFKEEGTNSL